jgi:hypothetical protein
MKQSIFTPYRIILRERRQRFALLLVIIFTPTILFNLTVGVYATETCILRERNFLLLLQRRMILYKILGRG